VKQKTNKYQDHAIFFIAFYDTIYFDCLRAYTLVIFGHIYMNFLVFEVIHILTLVINDPRLRGIDEERIKHFE